MKKILIISVLTIALFACKKESNSNTGTNTSLHTIKYVINGSNCEVITVQYEDHPDTVLRTTQDTTLSFQVNIPFNPSIDVNGGNNYSPALETSIAVSIYWDNNLIGQKSQSGLYDDVDANFVSQELTK